MRNFSNVNLGKCRFFTTCTGSPSFHKNTKSSVVQPSRKTIQSMLIYRSNNLKTITLNYYIDLQLTIRSEHVCRSSGYNLRFIGHDRVSDILNNNNENIKL